MLISGNPAPSSSSRTGSRAFCSGQSRAHQPLASKMSLAASSRADPAASAWRTWKLRLHEKSRRAMLAVDTDVVVRFLTDDDAAQHKTARVSDRQSPARDPLPGPQAEPPSARGNRARSQPSSDTIAGSWARRFSTHSEMRSRCSRTPAAPPRVPVRSHPAPVPRARCRHPVRRSRPGSCR